MVMDTTQSMNQNQGTTDCPGTAISCALAGVQTLLKNLAPCPPSGCSGSPVNNASGGGANYSNAVDRVSLLAFPAVSSATAANDYGCSGLAPVPVPYQTPFPSTSTYQIVNFSSDYRTSDSATSLNSSSDIVKAVGGAASCTAMTAEGGEGTYYAQAIYQAQAYLAAEKVLYPKSQNVLIVLSDGSANATCTLSLSGVCTAGPMTGASTTSTTYPSTLQQCAQAVAAAQAAWTAGTTVYSVNFGAEASGCTTDTSPTIAPCQTMLQMATAPGKTSTTTYFSDDPATGTDPTCTAAARPENTLNEIFTAIAADLTVAKLIQ
jgi:hypothetical protein